MICEPVIILQDIKGRYHLDDALPYTTIIDTHNLIGMWMTVERDAVHFHIDDRKVVYGKIGMTPEGLWVCKLRYDSALDDGQ